MDDIAKQITASGSNQNAGGIMFKLCVYYNGVLRYTLVADMQKAQALRDQGFYVVVKAAA
ncbi:MAG: hypothetical protein WA635_13055 [Gallionella sp.]